VHMEPKAFLENIPQWPQVRTTKPLVGAGMGNQRDPCGGDWGGDSGGGGGCGRD
jgi:hypothetical protein